MQIHLHQKKILIGGSTNGIGKAIALQCASIGGNVTIVGRNEDDLKTVLQSLHTSNNQQHQYLLVDYNNFTAYQQIISNYFNNNCVDILINNTPGPPAANHINIDFNQYQRAFDLLFKTNVFTTNLAIESMKKNNFGRIINVSSMTVKEPFDNLILSNTMRAALSSWAKTLANAVAPFHITVNTILTGFFDTERFHHLQQIHAENTQQSFQSVVEKITNTIPMKRLGNPNEYAYLVAFLSSEYADYITGASISIDGGYLKNV